MTFQALVQHSIDSTSFLILPCDASTVVEFTFEAFMASLNTSLNLKGLDIATGFKDFFKPPSGNAVSPPGT